MLVAAKSDLDALADALRIAVLHLTDTGGLKVRCATPTDSALQAAALAALTILNGYGAPVLPGGTVMFVPEHSPHVRVAPGMNGGDA